MSNRRFKGAETLKCFFFLIPCAAQAQTFLCLLLQTVWSAALSTLIAFISVLLLPDKNIKKKEKKKGIRCFSPILIAKVKLVWSCSMRWELATAARCDRCSLLKICAGSFFLVIFSCFFYFSDGVRPTLAQWLMAVGASLTYWRWWDDVHADTLRGQRKAGPQRVTTRLPYTSRTHCFGPRMKFEAYFSGYIRRWRGYSTRRRLKKKHLWVHLWI